MKPTIPVDYVEFGGKKHPVIFGYYALKYLQRHSKKGLGSLEADIGLYEPLLYYALKIGYQIEGKEFDLKLRDMEMALVECFKPVQKLLNESLSDDDEEVEKSEEGVGNVTKT